MKKIVACYLALAMLVAGFAQAAMAEKKAKQPVDPAAVYAAAKQELENGNLYDAKQHFESLKDYEQSAQYATYVDARILVMKGELPEAKAAYDALGAFMDATANAEALADRLLCPVVSALTYPSTDPASFRWGLMDANGVQKTKLEWRYVFGLADLLILDNASSSSDGTATLGNNAGQLASENQAAYLVYNGDMDVSKYGSPLPAYNRLGYGLIDAKGEVLVKADYAAPAWIARGMAAMPTQLHGPVALFNLSARPLPLSPIGTFDEVSFPYYDSTVFAVRKGEAWSIIDRDGKALAGPFEKVGRARDGLIPVCMDKKWGYVDTNGAEAIAPMYEDAGDFSEGIAAVKQGGQYIYIDKDGKQPFDYSFAQAGVFSDGLAAVKQGARWGYIDRTGEYVLKPIYDAVDPFQPLFHLASVQIEEKWGLIDKTGKVVAKPVYEAMDVFDAYGFCFATTISGQLGLLNTKGKEVVKVGANFIGNISHGTRFIGKGTDYMQLFESGKTGPKFRDKHSKGQYSYSFDAAMNTGIFSMCVRYMDDNTYVTTYFDNKGKEIPVQLDPALN